MAPCQNHYQTPKYNLPNTGNLPHPIKHFQTKIVSTLTSLPIIQSMPSITLNPSQNSSLPKISPNNNPKSPLGTINQQPFHLNTIRERKKGQNLQQTAATRTAPIDLALGIKASSKRSNVPQDQMTTHERLKKAPDRHENTDRP